MKQRLFCLLSISASVVLAQHGSAYRGGMVTPPLPKPRFVLTDTSGTAFDFRQRTEGYVTLLFFGYTNCPDQCPMHMATLGAALKKLPGGIADQVKLVFVTTDPARDSPAAVQRWLDLFDRRFIGLSGTEQAIEAVEWQEACHLGLSQEPDAACARGLVHGRRLLHRPLQGSPGAH